LRALEARRWREKRTGRPGWNRFRVRASRQTKGRGLRNDLAGNNGFGHSTRETGAMVGKVMLGIWRGGEAGQDDTAEVQTSGTNEYKGEKNGEEVVE